MYKPTENIQNSPSVDYNQWLKRFDTQLNETKNRNSKSTQNCKANEQENVNIKLWGLVY